MICRFCYSCQTVRAVARRMPGAGAAPASNATPACSMLKNPSLDAFVVHAQQVQRLSAPTRPAPRRCCRLVLGHREVEYLPEYFECIFRSGRTPAAQPLPTLPWPAFELSLAPINSGARTTGSSAESSSRPGRTTRHIRSMCKPRAHCGPWRAPFMWCLGAQSPWRDASSASAGKVNRCD